LKVLLDECCHRRLRRELAGPEVEIETVQSQGWHGLQNGDLLRRIEGRFDILVTQDQNVPHQNAIAGRSFAVVMLKTKSGRWHELQPLVPKLREALGAARAGTVTVIA
jgi:hypothetical protein